MAERTLAGTRVRNRRLDRGLKQADLARQVGISASYLNLIEHNRRRIGATLLADLARVLDIGPELLEEEVAASVLAPLKEAASGQAELAVDPDQAEELVARFPDWAGLIVAQRRRIGQLEARLEALSNRLAHDTQIATSLHEVISTATSIRSTASILVDSPDLERDWQARFHKNIDGDSERLSASSQALLGLLDTDFGEGDAGSAVEQAEAHWAAGLGSGGKDAVRDPIVQAILERWEDEQAEDAQRLPLEGFLQAARQVAFDPARLAAQFGQRLDVILRRLAQIPEGPDVPPMGLARCDAAGVVVFQKPVLDFRLPRSGAACPIWPLYQALTQPGRALRQVVRMPGAGHTTFECFALADVVGDVAFGAVPQIEATMLVRPARAGAEDPVTVGPGCRVCSAQGCAYRRQPSIVRGEA